MQELSLHILDIVQNSIRAKATKIQIEIYEDLVNNQLKIIMKDNGSGIDEELVKAIKNPFSTTRTTRKVGLGIPLLLEACQRCNGDLDIASQVGVGTTITATFKHDHIDRAPMGDIVSTITMLILSSPEIRYIFTYYVNELAFVMDTDEIKKILEGVPITDLSIIKWLETYMQENIDSLKDS